MYRFNIDYSELRRAINGFEHVQEIDILKEVRWYLNQVYRDLSRKHGKRYSYITPPGNNRTNLRVRSRRLLNDLRDSRFVRGNNKRLVAGWDIPSPSPTGSYVGVHTAITGNESPYRLTPSKTPYTYTTKKGEKRILIPLRAGMTSDGKPKPITSRSAHRLKTMPFHIAKTRLDWSGEDLSKFKSKAIIIYKISGRRKIPMYVLAKQARIPRRLQLGAAMENRREDFLKRVETQIERALKSVKTK